MSYAIRIAHDQIDTRLEERGARRTHLSVAQPAPSAIAKKSYFIPNGHFGIGEIRAMKTMSARDAKNGFGLLIDTARAEPVTVEKHGRGVVVVMSVEEYERLKAAQQPASSPEHNTGPKA